MSFLSNVAKNKINKASVQKTIQKRLNTAASVAMTEAQSWLQSKMASLGFPQPIGCLGDIVFICSSREVHTFTDWERNSSARLASHNVMGGRPIIEFLGPDTQTITFTMQFNVFLGVNPAAEAEKIRQLCEAGCAMQLIINNSPIGDNLWVIESVGEKTLEWDNIGNILTSTVQVTLKEYVDDNPVWDGNAVEATEGTDDSEGSETA